MVKNQHFDDIAGLSRLPYFIMEGGRLRLKSGVLDAPVTDFHAHLGWHYLLTRPIDLWARKPVKHFFPSDIPLHLERYSALDMPRSDAAVCRRETVRGIVDTRGYSSTHTVPNILGEMDELGIGKSVLLAIDYPFLSSNSREALEAAGKTPESKRRLAVFASIHPYLARMEERLASFIEAGAVGLKVHTQMQLFRATHPRALRIYALAQKYHLPVLFHTGLSPLAPSWQKRFVAMKDFEKIVKQFPGVTFILGHGGGRGGEEEALEIARTHENVYLETSGQPPQVISLFLRKADPKRILYGSDWPYFPMALPFAKALLATETAKNLRPFIFWENAEKLLGRR